MKFISLLFFICTVGCSPSTAPKDTAAYRETIPAATATPSPERTTTDDARVLVGLDDGSKTAADAKDIRVKRVEYLLKEISGKTNEPILSISAAVDKTSDFLENDFGKNVSRQQILEEAKEFYDANDKISKSQSFQSVMLLVLAKYGK